MNAIKWMWNGTIWGGDTWIESRCWRRRSHGWWVSACALMIFLVLLLVLALLVACCLTYWNKYCPYRSSWKACLYTYMWLLYGCLNHHYLLFLSHFHVTCSPCLAPVSLSFSLSSKFWTRQNKQKISSVSSFYIHLLSERQRPVVSINSDPSLWCGSIVLLSFFL